MSEKFKEKINSLIEKRIGEAAKKELTKKLLCISKFLGRPIKSQSLFDNKLDDPWRLEDDFIYDPDLSIQEADDDWNTQDIGFHFDGLKCGINLCVTALIYDSKLEELKATYNGYLVYAEIEGELKAYAPFAAWEDPVNMFYEAAVEIEKKKMLEEKAKTKQENEVKIKEFWQSFRNLWGY